MFLVSHRELSKMWYKFSLLFFIALVSSVNCLPEGRVVNGTASDISKYPFVVSLRGVSGSHSCGGSIIAPRWILTAAHCVNGGSPSRVTVQYGSTRINAYSENVANVKRIIVHEGYSASKYVNDIALLELEKPLVYNYKTIAPVALPDSFFEVPQTQNGAPGVLIGWGLDASGGYIQSVLQEVDLKIYSDKECTSRHNGTTIAQHLCGGVDEGGKGQCSGDSGGPLLYNGSVQLGIVSWSIKPCTVAPYPGVYTKVSHFIHWIYKKMV